MNYYICGYNNKKILISKPLKKKNNNFDNKIYKNIINSNSVFDFSLPIKDKEKFVCFVLCSENYDIVYSFLVRHRNTKLYNKMNIFITFNLEINCNNIFLNKIYYDINREYPFKKILFNMLIKFLPTELIFMIYKYLDKDIKVSFIINKDRYSNLYYFNMPKIVY